MKEWKRVLVLKRPDPITAAAVWQKFISKHSAAQCEAMEIALMHVKCTCEDIEKHGKVMNAKKPCKGCKDMAKIATLLSLK